MRFQGGTLFPARSSSSSCSACSPIVYARESRPLRRSASRRSGDPLARRVRLLRVRHLAAEAHRHKEEKASTRPGNTGSSTTSTGSSACTPTATASSTTTRSRPSRRQAGQARRVPRRVRHRAPDTELVVPADRGWRGVRSTTTRSATARTWRSSCRVVGQLHRHRRVPDLHHRPRQHPDQERRHGVRRSRSSRRTTDDLDADVGRGPADARRRRRRQRRPDAPTSAGRDHPVPPDRRPPAPATDQHDRRRPATPAATTRPRDDPGVDQHDDTGDHHHGRLMRAVVLVGGFGTRLRPLTLPVPKPMLPVGHVPIIERLVANLVRGGVTDVTLALGFKPEPFVAAFPDGTCAGPRCTTRSSRSRSTPPARSGSPPTQRASTTRSSSPTATCSPTSTSARSSRSTGGAAAEATIHLIAVDDPSAFGVVATDADGRVERFVEKPAPGTAPCNLINAGTYVLEPSVLDRIPPGARCRSSGSRFPPSSPTAGCSRWPPTTTGSTPAAGLYLQANLDMLTARESRTRATPFAARRRRRRRRPVSSTRRRRRCHASARRPPVTDSVVLARRRRRRPSGSGRLGGDGRDRCRRPTSPAACSARHGRSSRANDVVAAPDRPPADSDVKIMVVGGAGFIGSHLVDRLLAEQHGRRRRRPVDRLARQPRRRARRAVER